MREASLYIHVPFCAGGSLNPGGKCDYCDFYSVPLAPDDGRPGLFVQTLLADAERLIGERGPGRIPTLYIGGGTPSVLGAAGIGRLLQGVLEIIGRTAAPPREITVEANPESSGEAFLAAARNGGASRLSLGVQSFYGPSRRAVRRIGAAPGSDETVLPGRLKLAAEYFPGAFSADLIAGLPFQTEEILLDDIAALLDFKPAHVSLYALTVEPGTPLAASAARRLLPRRDEADRLWLAGRDALEKAGYRQYEVSNFCLSGKESRHNIRYWRMQSWLALGPAASGTVIDDRVGAAGPREGRRGFRYTVPPDLDAWLASGGSFSPDPGAAAPAIEELDAFTLIKESFLMGFRYREGPDDALFASRFGRGIDGFIPKTLASWRERNLLQKEKTALKKEGLLFLDPFLIDAFNELEECACR